MTANKGEIMSGTALQEAVTKLAVAATDAAEAGRQFNADLEATQHRLYAEHLERRERWDEMRIQKRPGVVDIVPR